MLTTKYSFDVTSNMGRLYFTSEGQEISFFKYENHEMILASREGDNEITEVEFIDGMKIIHKWILDLKRSINVISPKFSDRIEFGLKDLGPNKKRLEMKLENTSLLDVTWDKTQRTLKTKSRPTEIHFSWYEFEVYVSLLEVLEFLIKSKLSEGV